MKGVFNSKWITAREFAGRQGADIKNFHMRVRKTFYSPEDHTRAMIRITADDYYKLYINGRYVCQGPAPGYHFAYNYNEYDITDFIAEGRNTLEVSVYYQGLINRVHVSGDERQGMVADVYFNGAYAFGSDESWEYTVDRSFITGKVVGYDTAFLEDRDMRIKPDGYVKCVAAENDDHIFADGPVPVLSVYTVRTEPEKEDNRYFYDFGQEYAGNLKIRVLCGNSGGKIIIHCAEELENDGSVKYKMRCGCDYEETCLLDGGENIIEQYDYKCFRYAEIMTEGEVLAVETEAVVRHWPFPEKYTDISTDNAVLREVFNLCKNTVKYGVQETFIDCPSREKGQYLGDAYVTGRAHMLLTGDGRTVKKALENFAQSIVYGGTLLAVAPCAHKQCIADYALLYSDMLYDYYNYTKDAETLSKLLPVCVYINEYFSKYAGENGLLCKVDGQWNLVDWPDGCRDGYDFELTDPIGEGCHNVINSFYIFSVMSEERIRSALGEGRNPEKEALIRKLIESYNGTFLNKETGLYTDSAVSAHSSVHSNMLPLAFGICPEQHKSGIADFLVRRGMRCGTYMSYFYLSALCAAGRYGDAVNAIVSTSENSWYNMIKEGATTCFEAWGKDKKWNTSLFHPWSAAPAAVLLDALAGKTDEFTVMHR